jgi:WD40 repeat protein
MNIFEQKYLKYKKKYIELKNFQLGGQNIVNPMTLLGHIDIVASVACSADGTKICSGSGDKTVKVWKNNSIILHLH